MVLQRALAQLLKRMALKLQLGSIVEELRSQQLVGCLALYIEIALCQSRQKLRTMHGKEAD